VACALVAQTLTSHFALFSNPANPGITRIRMLTVAMTILQITQMIKIMR